MTTTQRAPTRQRRVPAEPDDRARPVSRRPGPSADVRRRRTLAVLSTVAVGLVLLVTTTGRAARAGSTAAVTPAPVAGAAGAGRSPAGGTTAAGSASGGTPPAAGGSAAGSGVSLGAGQFSKGACMAQAPTAGDRHATVLLDAGHGGPDPGATGTTAKGAAVDERALTLPIVADAALLLRAGGYRVVVTRTADTAVGRLGAGDVTASGTLTIQGEHADTQARVTCANLSGAGVLVSVHFNAFSDGSARGLLTTYDDSRTFSAANLQFANLLDADVVAALAAGGWSVPDRGVLPDTTVGAPALTAEAHAYGHLLLLGPAAAGWLDHPTTMPGALLEPLFITNPAEATVAASGSGQHAIAAGIATAVEAFLPGTGPPVPPATTAGAG